MKKWLVFAAVLITVAILSRRPHPARDVAMLEPVQAVYIYQKHGTLCIETDTGASGSGNTLTEAAADLKSSASGEIFLDTAEFLLLDPRVAITADFYTIMFFITTAELYAGFFLLDIPYKLGLAVGIAIFDLMPILGVGGILLPWGAIALIMGDIRIGIGVIVLYIVICAMRYIIEPRFVGSQISLHPLATLVAMVVGLRLAGLAGMLVLPVTLMAITKLRRNSAGNHDRPLKNTEN